MNPVSGAPLPGAHHVFPELGRCPAPHHGDPCPACPKSGSPSAGVRGMGCPCPQVLMVALRTVLRTVVLSTPPPPARGLPPHPSPFLKTGIETKSYFFPWRWLAF